MAGEASRINTDFYITYHHGDEMAARWIAAELKQARFTTLSDSWDFLRGETALEKIDSMFSVSRSVMVLISSHFLQSQGDLIKSFGKSRNPFSKVFLVRIHSCEIESVFGSGEYIDLAGIKEAEAVKRLLAAVGAAVPGEKETESLPVAPLIPEEILAKRKQELEQLLDSCIKHDYHMKLDLEHEVEKVVEVENEKTREMEKRKQWVWEPVLLETVLKDGKNYILVNPSGMGKTTFLTYVASTLLDRDAHYPFLPFFFTCIGINNRDGSIENFILRQVESVYTSSQGTLVSREWENLCILIDALDQARDVDDIVSSLLLHDKPLHYKNAKIILSSRQNTADKVKEGFEKIRLKLPEADEVQHYLGEENYKKLEGIIESSGELVKAPVLLEMLKIITEKGHVVSTLYNRAALYTEFTKILLDQERSKPRFWQDRLSIRHFIDYELEQALEKIAFFSLADNEILEIPKEKLVQYCESPEKKEALLNIGIILELFEDREQKIVFRHQSFQAYFSARYIYNQQPELFRELVEDIAFFYNDVWYEVMRFFMGLEKDPPKSEAIIDAISQTDEKKDDLTQPLRLIFAVFLMSEVRVSIEFFQRLYEQLRDLLKNNKQYCFFFNSNSDKFSTGNDEQRRDLLLIFESLLRDKNVRSYVANAFENIGSAKDIPLLEPLLKDKNSDVHYIGKIVLAKIIKIGDIPFLEPLLRDGNDHARLAAVEAFGKIGTAQDIPLLEPLIHDKDIILCATAEAIGKIIKAKDTPPLEPLLRDESEYIRRAVANELEKIIKAPTIPPAFISFCDEGWDNRCDAAKALGKIVTAQDILLLELLIKDENWNIRHVAAEAFVEIGTREHIHLLKPLLGDFFTEVRWSAQKALEKIINPKDIPLLLPLLHDNDWDVRCAAVYVLEKIGTSKHIPLLEPLLMDEDEYVRGAAAGALGKIGTAKDIPLLEPLLRDKDEIVQSFAASALENIVTSDQIPFLKPLLLKGKEWNVRRAAAEALGKIGNIEHIPLLAPLLWDENEKVRMAAIEALGKIGNIEHIPLLAPLLWDENENVRMAAIKALEKIGISWHIHLLEPLLRDECEGVRIAAIEALEKIGTSGHIPLLEPLLWDKSRWCRQVAVEVLGNIGYLEHMPLLEPLLRDKDRQDSSTVAIAIEKIYKRSTPKLRIDRVLPTKKEKKVLPIKPFSGGSLHILHISDIHYALEKDPTIICIFHEFLQDIKKWRSQQNNTKIHSICLTGDIAQSGHENQYDSINEKINAILNTTGCPIENLFIIPGNHDVHDYDNISPQGKTLLKQVRDKKMSIDSHVLSNFDNYRQFHDKFAHYYRFIENSGYLNSLPEDHNHIPKTWYNRKLKDFPVRIIGLNSALFCLKDFCQYGNIRMGTHQFHEAFFQSKGKVGNMSENELVILLTHHPVNWLVEKESEDYSTLMERYSIIHLHGHIHKTKIEKKQRLFSSSGGYVSIGTGSLYGEKGIEDINTYHIITLDFEKQELHVWARRWNPDSGKWTVYDDDGNNRFPLPVAGKR